MSKALATSKNTPAQYFFVSKAVEIVSVTRCSWLVVCAKTKLEVRQVFIFFGYEREAL